eukprot:scaffold22621_cov36-Cyclotella_meneghiniana.AAC.3
MTDTRKEKATPIFETRREGWANPEAASVIRDAAGLHWSTRRKVKAPAGEMAGQDVFRERERLMATRACARLVDDATSNREPWKTGPT